MNGATSRQMNRIWSTEASRRCVVVAIPTSTKATIAPASSCLRVGISFPTSTTSTTTTTTTKIIRPLHSLIAGVVPADHLRPTTSLSSSSSSLQLLATSNCNTRFQVRSFTAVPLDEEDVGFVEDAALKKEKLLQKQERRKKRREKIKKQNAAAKALRLEYQPPDPQVWEDFFQEMAPFCLPLKAPENYVRRFLKRKPQNRQQFVEDTLVLVSSSSSSSSPTSTATATTATSKKTTAIITPEAHWMRLQLMARLNYLPLGSPKVMPSPSQLNLAQLEQSISIFMQARQKAVEEGLGWNTTDANNTEYISGLSHSEVQKKHQEKSQDLLEQEAQDFIQVLAHRLPPSKLEGLVEFLQGYVGRQKNDKRTKVRRIFHPFRMRLKQHIHLVAADIATFFYFDPVMAQRQDKVMLAQIAWDEAKDSFVKAMTEVHASIATTATPATLDGKDLQIIVRSDDSATDDDDDVVTEEEIVKSEDSSMSALEEIMEKTVIAPIQSPPKVQVPKRLLNSNTGHAVLKAIPHGDASTIASSSSSSNNNKLPESFSPEKMVFVDNLPIAITELELMELYSRCGPVQRVEIFNQRPELDPGRLSMKQKQAVRRRAHDQRYRNSLVPEKDVMDGKWLRPRTALYAIIHFANPESSMKATQDALRLFGMVMERHAIRSHAAESMTTLYVDGIPRGSTSMDRVEQQLREILHPDLYIFLDKKKGPSHDLGSCEIHFPTFLEAYQSYQKLHQNWDCLDYDAFCTLNWMKTPKYADMYWTRQITF